jgi:hypothetical protein
VVSVSLHVHACICMGVCTSLTGNIDLYLSKKVLVSFFCGVQRRVLQFLHSIFFVPSSVSLCRSQELGSTTVIGPRPQLSPPVFGPYLVPRWALFVAVAVFVSPARCRGHSVRYVIYFLPSCNWCLSPVPIPQWKPPSDSRPCLRLAPGFVLRLARDSLPAPIFFIVFFLPRLDPVSHSGERAGLLFVHHRSFSPGHRSS